MKKSLINLIAAFIPNQTARRNFRARNTKTTPMEKYFSSNFCRSPGCFDLCKADWIQYEQDAIALKQNLSPRDTERLNTILKRMENVALSGGVYKYTDVYSRDEMIKHKKMRSISHRVIKHDNCWEYNGFKLPKNIFEPSIFFDMYELDQLATVDRINQNKDLAVLDVGAYIGDSALILRRFFPNNKIYAFEAITPLCETMRQTVALNNADNIIPVNLALGDKTDKLKMKYGKISSVTDLIKLDDFVEQNNIKVGLIKTDIEGAEWGFLQGAINTIKTQRPTLIISIYHNYNDFFKIKPFIESLNLGYKFSITDSCYGQLPVHEITLNCWID